MKNILNTLFLFFPFILLLSSCSKAKETTELTGKVNVQVKAFINDVEIGKDINSNKANAKLSPITYSNTVDFNEDYIIVSTLSPKERNTHIESSNIKIASNNNKATSTVMTTTNTYRVLIFKTTGEFITDRIYTQQEAGLSPTTSEELYLNRGVTYTIVAYSANTANSTDLSNMLNQLGSTTRTLGNSYIQGSVSQEILFYKTNYTASTNSDDYLNIVFKRKSSQVSTILDVSQTGYSMSTNVVANYRPNNTTTQIDFENEQLTYPSSTNTGMPLTFTYSSKNNISNSIATSSYTNINTNSSQNFLDVSTLTINSISNSTTINPFSGKNIVLTPGYQYIMNVSIVPRDQFIDNYKGYPAARINGKIWMRHNLGADYTQSPDVVGAESTRGNTYQWGRNIVCVYPADNTAYLYPLNPASWYPQNNLSANAWNGTSGDVNYKESNPTKGNADPCPDGYRVPAALELSDILDATLQVRTAPSDNKMGAMRMTSKRNKNVFLTFPLQLASNIYTSLNNIDFYLALYSRYSNVLMLHTSYYDNSQKYPATKYIYWTPSQPNDIFTKYDNQTDNGHGNTVRPAPIRCIATE